MSREKSNENLRRQPREFVTANGGGSRQALLASVSSLRNLREYTESSMDSRGSQVAEAVLLKNVPTLDFIVDGRFKGGENGESRSDVSVVGARIISLPAELVDDSQKRINTLLATIISVPSLATARRLRAYLPITIPETVEGYKALLYIAQKYNEATPIPQLEQIKTNLNIGQRVIGQLDQAVVEAIQKDDQLSEDLENRAREQAKLRFPELLAEDSDQIAKMRSLVAEQKMAEMRREFVQTGRARENSRFEVLVNEIIKNEGLSEQVEAIKEKRNSTLEKAKMVVLASLARKRATRRVVSMIENDPLLCQAIAKRQRMTSGELLGAEETIKMQAANNALNTRNIVLSIEERKVFYGERVIEEEKKKLREDLEDPLVFMANLTDEEYIIVKCGIPKLTDAKTVFDLAKGSLKKQLEDGVEEGELLEVLIRSISRELRTTVAIEAVDAAIKAVGITPSLIIDNPSALAASTDKLISSAIRILRTRTIPSPKGEVQAVSIEVEQPEKPYDYKIPSVTIGKSQLVAPDNLLRYGTTVTTALTQQELAEAVDRLIQSSSKFDGYFAPTESAYYYPPEKKAEMLYSMVGRGAGSKLAGTPLFELDPEMKGIIATLDPEMDKTVVVEAKYGPRSINNAVRLSPLFARIGQPYSDRLVRATELVADAVDTVAGNLHRVIEASDKDSVPVEDVTNYVRENLNDLLNEGYRGRVPGRSVLQMDYFLLYPPDYRELILKTYERSGSIETIMPLLKILTAEGDMEMTIFDISGGSGGVGISEILSQRILGRESGHMQAYLNALLGSYKEQKGKLPERVLIVPREADLTLMNFEYTPVEEALRALGIPTVGITTMGMLQQALEVYGEDSGKTLQVPTLKGEVIAPELIIKRFTFPNEGKGTGYRGDILTRLPEGVVIEPNNPSRIVASDKRVNSPILRALEPQLKKLGVEVMPYLELDIQERGLGELTSEVVRFMEGIRQTYPEIDYLGAVLKTGDKIPGREGTAGEVISAYPIPASVRNSTEMQRLFITRKIRELALKGVTGVIAQPNVLSLVVDNNGVLMPKYELKMMAFANQRS